MVEEQDALSGSVMESAGARLLYIDNLRWLMILLVISMHAADTYSPLGNWYFVDRRPLSRAALLAFAGWQMYLQCFFMGLLFFVAGFFVPTSFDRKGVRKFLSGRAFRLGVPVLLYMFCIGPVTEYYVAHSWTSTQPTSFANEWLKHIRNGQFLQENGPLWFCLALLIFSAAYTLLETFQLSTRSLATKAPGSKGLTRFALLMATLTFVVRAGRPSPLLNMHLGDFPQYVLLFSAGIAAARRKWLPKLSFQLGMRWLGVVLPVGFAAWLALVVFGGALHGREASYSGGWNWQSAALCLWESFTCVAVCLGLLVLFREEFNSQGPFTKFLSRNAFSVYIFHPPIMVLAARVLSGADWPPLMMFGTLTGIASTLSFGLSAGVFRRVPGLRSIL